MKPIAVLYVLAGLILTVQALNKEQDCKCRISTKKIPYFALIIDGDVLNDQNSYPWLVDIMDDNFKKGTGCEATIINENFVMTSAICTPWTKENLHSGYLAVRGVEERVELEYTIKHPEFNKTGQFENDIAFIKLKSPLKFNDRVQPACLSTEKEKYSNPIAGHGAIKVPKLPLGADDPSKYIEFSKELRSGSVKDATDRICKSKANELICTDGHNNDTNVNVCFGDIGGALHNTNLVGKTQVVGVASSPSAKFDMDEPLIVLCSEFSTFARVSYYMDFIRQQVANEYCA